MSYFYLNHYLRFYEIRLFLNYAGTYSMVFQVILLEADRYRNANRQVSEKAEQSVVQRPVVAES